MIQAVLFDLDGTLLEIDLDGFLHEYFGMLGPVIAELLSEDQGVPAALQAVIAGTEAMGRPHPGRTNRDVFEARFEELTGVRLSDEHAAAAVERFYAETFPSLAGEHHARAGAAHAVRIARELELKLALATNPIFPAAAVLERLAWTSIGPEMFDVITSYETMTATKPHAEYYRQTAEILGVDPTACVMVGDDPVLDLAAAEAGMRTFYVGSAKGAAADWTGSLEDLAALLPALADGS